LNADDAYIIASEEKLEDLINFLGRVMQEHFYWLPKIGIWFEILKEIFQFI